MIKPSSFDTFKKTETILYLFPEWKKSENAEIQKMCARVEQGFKIIEQDFYFDIIELKYFRRWTHEKIAEHFDVDVSVISKQRTKLVNKIRPIIFDEEFLKELIER